MLIKTICWSAEVLSCQVFSNILVTPINVCDPSYCNEDNVKFDQNDLTTFSDFWL